jgi:hypothetical protein
VVRIPMPQPPRRHNLTWVRKYCAVPDCGAELAKNNISGVCKVHAHHWEFCRCRSCLADIQRHPENVDTRVYCAKCRAMLEKRSRTGLCLDCMRAAGREGRG